jgi:tripartite-type tricarboxylate transporter receptor subunit TctC
MTGDNGKRGAFSRRRRLLLQVAPLLCCGAPAAHAQGYPAKSVRFLVGPGSDVLARLIADKLRPDLGVTVVVDQKPQAGGIVAYGDLAKSPPDGSAMMLSSSSFTISGILQSNLPYDVRKDFVPVSLLATIPILLVVNPRVPASNFKELVELIRRSPGKYNYGSSGVGTPAHLAGEMFKQMAGLDMVHVAYSGLARAVTDLLAGNVDLMFVIAPSAMSMVGADKLRALAVCGSARYAALPDIPTVAEQGYPNFYVVGWNGVHMPARTPADTITRMSDALAKIVNTPDFRKAASDAGFEPVGSSAAEFDTFVKDDLARFGKVIKDAGIRIE